MDALSYQPKGARNLSAARLVSHERGGIHVESIHKTRLRAVRGTDSMAINLSYLSS